MFASVLTPFLFIKQALVIPEKFQHILRVLNTNIDGKQKIMFALTSIKVSEDSYFSQKVPSVASKEKNVMNVNIRLMLT